MLSGFNHGEVRDCFGGATIRPQVVRTRRYSVYIVVDENVRRVARAKMVAWMLKRQGKTYQQQQVSLGDGEELDMGEVIEDQLYVGSLSAARDVEGLRREGITAVLTTAKNLIVKLPPTFNHKVIEMFDYPDEDILSKLPTAFSFLDEQFAENRKVLVHCAAGVSRSVGVCVAYLMCRYSYPYKVALEIIRRNRDFANPNVGFSMQLAELEKAGGSIEKAKLAYAERASFRAVLLPVWRNRAHEIHRKVDGIENKVHSAEKYTDCKDDEAVLVRLRNNVDKLMEECGGDPFTEVILYSAKGKIDRLISLIQGNDLSEAAKVTVDSQSDG